VAIEVERIAALTTKLLAERVPSNPP